MKIDEEAFLSDKFDVSAYANAVLAGKPYQPDKEDEVATITGKDKGKGESVDAAVGGGTGEKGDLGVELAKLNYGIVSALCLQSLALMLREFRRKMSQNSSGARYVQLISNGMC